MQDDERENQFSQQPVRIERNESEKIINKYVLIKTLDFLSIKI